jgi:transcriptional regulator with XRE-family HTH domain
MHRTYVSGIERGGRNVSLSNIVRLARALKVSPAELMREVD